MLPMLPLLGFAPDLPSSTPGLMVDCVNVVPTEVGFAAGPIGIATPGIAALPSAARGGAVIALTTGARRIFSGTQTRLYEFSGGSWVDVSRGTFYTGSADNRWSFAQFGNVTLASNDNQAIQASTTAGAFADVATAPVARIVFAVDNFVMALNTSDATFGDQGDRWWCSGIFNHATWTPSVSTQANSGRLVSDGGDFTAGLALGKQAIAYKASGMWSGTYVGGGTVWQWDQVPGDQGAVGPEAVADVGGAHAFVGEDNIWLFDGTRPRPLGGVEVRQWFYRNLSPSFRYRTIVRYERQSNRLWIFFPRADSTDGTPDRAIVYHLQANKWGRSDRVIQASLPFVQPGLTIETLPTVAASIDAMPDIAMDSQFWLQGGRSLSVIDGAGQLLTLTGGGGACSFTTGDIGDDDIEACMSMVRLRFLAQPITASCAGQVFSNIGGPARAGRASILRDGKFDIRQSGRWHRLTFSMTGSAEFIALAHEARAGGDR